MTFPVSGVEVFPLWPPLLTFALAMVCSVGGITGAFLLLPLQISLFGFTSPAVTATNHTYNVLAGLGGTARFFRERRLVRPLSAAILWGSLPGTLAGVFVRISLLAGETHFKGFVGAVLMLMAAHLALREWRTRSLPGAGGRPASLEVSVESVRGGRMSLTFAECTYTVDLRLLAGVSFLIGVVGGAYGIGGGLLATAYLVGMLGLPVFITAGATLLATTLTSLTGVFAFSLAAFLGAGAGAAVAPDWALGALFGVGGLAGSYAGARLQRYLPARAIRVLITFFMLLVAMRYLSGWAAALSK